MFATPLKRFWRLAPVRTRHRFWTAVAKAREASLPLRVGLARRGAPRRGPGVAVAGLFSDTRGIAQAARLFAAGLADGGWDPSRIDAGPALGVTPVLDVLPAVGGSNDSGVIVTCLNPPELLRWLDVTGGRPLTGRRHVGFWAWELSEPPPGWEAATRFVDAIWCHSEFSAAALRRFASCQKPVRVLPPPIHMTPQLPPDRRRFGWRDDVCVILSVLDLKSTAARKNPEGAVSAYLGACPEPRSDAMLVCKISGSDADTGVMARLADVAAERPDVNLLTETLSPDDMAALVASCDVFLSLHRAEGFGMLTAEAAWMGRAIVTTGWSAPLEFLSPTASILLDHTLVPILDPQGLYERGRWAEPDLTQASDSLRRLIDEPDLRTTLGDRAKEHAAQVFARDAWVGRARSLLAEVGSPR